MTGRTPKTETGPGDDFARARDAFLLRLATTNTSQGALQIGILLAVKYANRRQFEETGELIAWPSLKTLHDQTGLFRGRIKRAIETLEKAKLIGVVRPETKGAGHHNRYSLIFGKGLTGETFKGPTTVPFSPDEKGLMGETLPDDEKGLTGETLKGPTGETGKVPPVRPDLTDDPFEGGAQGHEGPSAAPPIEGEDQGAGAGLEAPPCPSPDECSTDSFDLLPGEPATLEDLDMLEAMELEAEARPEAVAARAVRAVLGDLIFDAGAFVSALIGGFLHDDDDDRSFVGDLVAGIILDRGTQAGPIWTAILDLTGDLFEALDPDGAAGAIDDFKAAVGAAGESLKAATREAHDDDDNTHAEAVHG